MKKLLKTIAIALSLFLLAACGNNPPSLEDRTVEEASYTGVINSIDLNVFLEGTHQLTTEADETITIESPRINLNNYLNKKVMITGKMRTLIDNETKVFTVTELELKDLDTLSEWQDFEDKKVGYLFSYPPFWELIDDTTLTLKSNGISWVTIDHFDSIDESFEEYVMSKEGEENKGASVTVGAQKSVRYVSDESIRIYVPNPTKKSIYLITFSKSDDEEGKQEEVFYDFLETFAPLTTSPKSVTGELCGGIKRILCQEGYRCELNSTKRYAEGVCIALDIDAKGECPFVPTPKNCLNYDIKSTNKNGCPLSYVCLDEPIDSSEVSDDESVNEELAEEDSSEPEEELSETEEEKVIRIFKKYQSKILSSIDKIDRFEVDGAQKLLAVEYESNGEFRLVYRYSPSGNEYNFERATEYKRNSKGEWEVQKGESVDLEVSAELDGEGEVAERNPDLRYYDNPYKDFSVGYPKDWYFRSFGSIENSVWSVGFGESEIDDITDSQVELVILDEAKTAVKKINGGLYTIILPRDEDSHFRLTGAVSLKNEMDQIAASIENNLSSN